MVIGGSPSEASLTGIINQDTASVMSFNSSSASSGMRSRGVGVSVGGNGMPAQHLGTKVRQSALTQLVAKQKYLPPFE